MVTSFKKGSTHRVYVIRNMYMQIPGTFTRHKEMGIAAGLRCYPGRAYNWFHLKCLFVCVCVLSIREHQSDLKLCIILSGEQKFQ